MQNSTSYVALGALALFLTSGLLLRKGLARSAELDVLEDRVAALADTRREREVERAPDPDAAATVSELRGTLGALEARLERLELQAHRTPVVTAPETGRDPEALEASAPSSSEPAAGTRAELEDLMGLLGPEYDLRGSDEELERFFRLARETDLVDDGIAELEALVAARPDDLEARMELADYCVAKLMTLPGGPEQGLWGARAEEQWSETAERDPDHWRSHFSLGNNYAYYPDVMGKTDDAIRYLERAREIQETRPAEPDHVHTYLSLANLYLRRGMTEDARTLLESGLRFLPMNAELERALASLGD